MKQATEERHRASKQLQLQREQERKSQSKIGKNAGNWCCIMTATRDLNVDIVVIM